ncbi:MAG: hypothetical protein R2932_21535 [Caldilineaceae bacterium]
MLALLRQSLLIRLQAEVDTGLMANFLEHLLAFSTLFISGERSGDLAHAPLATR